MKRLLVFVLCIHLVRCRRTYQESQRQLDDVEVEQNCTLKCNEQCIYCETPKKCNDDEVKCGENHPEAYPDCPPDEICVPNSCICKYTED